jgi:hypothetical protein
MAAVLLAALILDLWILDVISLQDLRESLGKLLGVIAVTTLAAALMSLLLKLNQKK